MVDWAGLSATRVQWLRTRWLGGRPGPAQLGREAHGNLAEFTDHCTSGDPSEVTDVTLSAIAMVFFGPAGTPPSEVWDGYVAAHRELTLRRPKRRALNPFDLMLAFGCGWRRDVELGRGPWWGRWEVAYAAMIFQVEASLVASGRLLANQFPQFALTSDDLSELPGDFAVSLLGSCDCGHQRRDGQPASDKACSYEPHDIGSWDPLKCHLRPFVDQAVRGTATNQIRGGAFAESLIYRDLERQGRILRRRAEFKECPGCGELFDETSCPTPGCPGAGEVTVKRVARANWLILPAHQGGDYQEVVRWVCGRCSGLYPMRLTREAAMPAGPCPVCSWTPDEGTQPRRITVWVRVPRPAPTGDVGHQPGCDPCDPQGGEDDDYDR